MPKTADTDTPYPFVSPAVALVVFIGGSLGTGIRYAMASLPVIGRQDANHIGSFHLGTFAVNMIACLCYAALVTYLTQAPWIHAKRRELISRAFGMGVCGGLSTLSTLALEVFTSLRGGNALEAVLYIVITFACGFIVALIGVRCSNWLLDHHDNVEYSKDPQATDTREAQQ